MFYRFLLIYLFEFAHIDTGAGLVFQSPSLTVDEGSNVTLFCDISRVIGQCSCVRWLLYQPAGGLVVYHHLKGLTTITNKGQQDTHCLLNITKASLSDSGRFYCLLPNAGFDYMGNGTELTVMDITDKLKENNKECKMNLEQVRSVEYQCLIPMAVLGGFSLLLIILAVTVMCVWQRRGKHQKNRISVSEDHQQHLSEVQYAALRFGSRR